MNLPKTFLKKLFIPSKILLIVVVTGLKKFSNESNALLIDSWSTNPKVNRSNIVPMPSIIPSLKLPVSKNFFQPLKPANMAAARSAIGPALVKTLSKFLGLNMTLSAEKSPVLKVSIIPKKPCINELLFLPSSFASSGFCSPPRSLSVCTSRAVSLSPCLRKKASAPVDASPPFNLTSFCRFCLRTFMSLAIPGRAIEFLAMIFRKTEPSSPRPPSALEIDSGERSFSFVGFFFTPKLPRIAEEMISSPPKKLRTNVSFMFFDLKSSIEPLSADFPAPTSPFPDSRPERYLDVKLDIIFFYFVSVIPNVLFLPSDNSPKGQHKRFFPTVS